MTKLVHKKIEGHKAIFFRYKMSEITYEFSLLSEVAQPLIPSFEQLLGEKYPKGVDVIEIDIEPYLITVAR